MGILSTRVALLAVLLAACGQACAAGYILHPERRGGPTQGAIDPAVAIIDGVLLLVGVIPGVIAFAVDISQGTLYTHGYRSDAGAAGAAGLVQSDLAPQPGESLDAAVARTLSQQAGVPVAPGQARYFPVDADTDLALLAARLARYEAL